MFYNKVIQIRISEELLLYCQTKGRNVSRFIRTLIRDEIKKREKKGEQSSATPEVRAKTPYTFLAKLVRVIDGDTILLDADLGFYIKAQVRVRLASVNVPPANTPRGKKAIKFIEWRLTKNNIVVESRTKEKYGRYLGYVYYHRSYTEFEDILRYGRVINEELVKNKLGEEL